jgi:hypothetical protein
MQAFSIKEKLLPHLDTNHNSKAYVPSQLLSHSNFRHDAYWHEINTITSKVHFHIVFTQMMDMIYVLK